MNKAFGFCLYALIMCFFLGTSCTPEAEKEQALFEQECSTCHQLPDIQALPKSLWEKEVLPEMAARMGIKEEGYNPLKDYTFKEMGAVIKSGIYSKRRSLSDRDWKRIKNYVLKQAPEELEQKLLYQERKPLKGFKARSISLDSIRGANFIFMRFDQKSEKLHMANIRGNIFEYDDSNRQVKLIEQIRRPVSDYIKVDSVSYVTSIGYLNPSELSSGSIIQIQQGQRKEFGQLLHRPVHTLLEDLNADGSPELVVSEFGHFTGSLSLLEIEQDGRLNKRILNNEPGNTRTIALDLNNDQKKDLLVLKAQAKEGIYAYMQREDGTFKEQELISFSPILGTSWFEVFDYEGDGDLDIASVHGDNADKTYVQKPYHGMRLYLNDGQMNFEQAYFFPLNGATRLVARDFDQDGDTDFALVASFPDYQKHPEDSFVYLENLEATSFQFSPQNLLEPQEGRWFLMDAGDFDRDGDDDLVISSFTYNFTPVPEELSDKWKESYLDILILENQLLKK